MPTTISFSFREPVFPATVLVKVNNKDVTEKFKITPTGGTGLLSISDGLVPSLGRNKQPFAPNVATVHATTQRGSAVGAARQFFIMAPAEPTRTTAVIPPDGGSIALQDYGSITFPSGSFDVNQLISLSATASAETAMDWDTTAAIFGSNARVAYEIRVNSGSTGPSSSFEVSLKVPTDFVALLPADGEVKLFAQMFQDSGQASLDSFELFDAKFENGTLSATLPPEAFTSKRTDDASFEAVIVIGMLRTLPPVNSTTSRTGYIGPEIASPAPAGAVVPYLAAAASPTCKGSMLGSPLDARTVSSKFNPPAHFGVDYVASDGTSVKAMADGVVDKIGFDERPLKTPDPRSGKLVKGWGRYVVIRHTDGSRTLYAHLQSDGVTATLGAPVSRGDLIAVSDNSGGSSGPHLHVEYAPNGAIYQSSSKTNPEPCIELASGSISIRDNGPAADDAFALFINGLQVCATAIGASNTCGVGALRSGTVQLALICTIAPDNLGTYELTLAGGLTFADRSLSRSGALREGESAAFSVLVP